METLIEFDKMISTAINGAWTPFSDKIMIFISEIWVWVPLYVAVIVWLFCKMPWKKALAGVLVVIAAFAFTDMFSAFMKEDVFQRLRPCNDPSLEDLLRLPDGKGGPFGFPSGHACNTFCFAIITSWLFKRRWWTVSILFWSIAISYSRIYLARHFLGDVLGGLIFGAAVAALAICLLKAIFKKIDENALHSR